MAREGSVAGTGMVFAVARGVEKRVRFVERRCAFRDWYGLRKTNQRASLRDVTATQSPERVALVAGELEATFVPALGMLGASLRHRGDELLGRTGELAQYVSAGSTIGIPFLHPWANRLAGFRYRAANREVDLEPARALLHVDANGLPIHGVPGAHLAWRLDDATPTTIGARFDWTTDELLAVFPYPHRLTQNVTLDPTGLTIATTLEPRGDSSVPISFGFHPYLRLPGAARDDWRLELPAMTRLALDERGIPTGAGEAFPGLHEPLRGRALDDGFADLPPAPSLAIEGGGRRISVSFLAGYTHAQVYAPAGHDFVALEPMAAPTNALVSGDGLRLARPGNEFRAAFRISVESA